MKIKKDFTLRSVMGQNVVLAEGANADSYDKMIKLNASAAMLWEALQGRDFEIEDAAELLRTHYGIAGKQALADARHFVGLLAEKGLIES